MSKTTAMLLAAAACCARLTSQARADDLHELRIADAVVTLIEQVEVPARGTGPLARLEVREGGAVRAGDDVGMIDDAGARLAVARAEAEYEIARAEAQNEFKVLAAAKAAAAANAELRRAVESAEKYAKSISQTELDRLRLVAERGELEARQAEHERAVARLNVVAKQRACEEARRNLDLHQIRMPADGVVVEVRRRAGEWVEPGMPVLRLVKMDSLRIEAFVSAADAVRIRAGAAVRFVAADTDDDAEPRPGKISYVSPEVDPVNGQVRIWAEVDNRNGALRPGLQGTLAVVLPAAAKPVARKPAEER